MKTLLTLSLTLATLSGYAQQAAPISELPLLPRNHADSAEVIHRAFQYFRRRERRGIILSGVAGSAQAVGMLSSTSNSTPLRTTLNITSGVIYTALLTDYIVNLAKLNKRQEAQALHRFELHQPQPRRVQRMLMAYTLGKQKF